MSRSSPPAADEFEVSVLGPGKGECIVIHLGSNEWCVVDSFVPGGLSESVAVEYLAGFNNGAVENIKLVVATHWHDDHIAGLASILKRVPAALFACSDALGNDSFFTLVSAAATGIQGRSGVVEFATILGMIDADSPKGGKPLASPKWASENRELLHLFGHGRSFAAKVTALSPSDLAKRLAMEEIAQYLPRPGDQQSRITTRNENHHSVVLWIEAGPLKALLGSDLQQTSRANEGWSAVLTCHNGHRAGDLAVFVKVPHHGSRNADVEEVWNKMLVHNPVAVITPFNPSKLPAGGDLRRLRKRTDHLYVTSLGPGKPPARDPSVEKMMNQILTERQVVAGRAGHVRTRWRVSEVPPVQTVEMFDGARQVTEEMAESR